MDDPGHQPPVRRPPAAAVGFLLSVAIAGTGPFSSAQESNPPSSPSTGISTDNSDSSIEERTRVHRLKTKRRSAFDAFIYVNRVPVETVAKELPEDLAGRILGRLANQEGRVLLKLPPSMSSEAYTGFKTFVRTEGPGAVGNCSVCHTLPNLTDLKSHKVGRNDTARPTPSLRNTGKDADELQQILLQKISVSRSKQVGDADDVAQEYADIRLQPDDVAPLVAFLTTLRDLSDTEFRRQILDAKQLDTTGDFD